MELNYLKNKYYILFFLLFSLTQASKAEVQNDTLSHIVIEHLNLFGGKVMEKFEINYRKNKLYRLSINAGYLHIKGGKRAWKIKTSKKQWNQLDKLINEVKPVCKSITNQEEKVTYYITFYNHEYEETTFKYSDNNVPLELKEILKYIRTKK